jgi:hypothetical protein
LETKEVVQQRGNLKLFGLIGEKVHQIATVHPYLPTVVADATEVGETCFAGEACEVDVVGAVGGSSKTAG